MQRLKTRLPLILLGVVVAILLAPGSVPAQSASEDVKKEAEEARRALDVFLREQKLLFKRGEFQLEFSTFYSQDTSDISLDTARSVTSAFTGRYGLIDNLELAVGLPFGYAERTDFSTRNRTHDQGVGDIRGQVRYQLWREEGARPDVILDLYGKSRTGGDTLLGTGHWDVGGGITLVKSLDPVVFFGRVGYTHTLERQGVDPGDEISYLIGMGFSLNDRVSLNMQVVGAYVGRIERNGVEISRSGLEILSLQFGVTVLVTKRLFVEPVVNFGLTEDAADVVIGLNVPFQF